MIQGLIIILMNTEQHCDLVTLVKKLNLWHVLYLAKSLSPIVLSRYLEILGSGPK